MACTHEQLDIIEQLILGNNVVVDAVAGSGKTTSIKYIAMAYRLDLILLLTYNANQRKNTKEETLKLCIKNMNTHTFHSCGYNFYSEECSRDSGIRDILASNCMPKPITSDDLASILIIDEVQDMNDLYYQFTLKIIRDLCKPNVKIVLIGDFQQGINAFNGAKIDYILNPEWYFRHEYIPRLGWSRCNLTETFRLTIPMVDLVNAVNESFGGYRKLISKKHSDKKPEYYICDTKFIYNKVREYLAIRSPHEILLLVPSARTSRQVTELCNMLSKDGVPLHITSDKSNSKQELTNGKLIVSTIHAIKGDERPIVFLVGFDDGVLPKMLRSERSDRHDGRGSLVYVALTRAKEELLIFHNYTNAFIVPRSIIEKYCEFNIMSSKFNKNYVNREYIDKDKPKAVTDLVKYLSNEVITECMKYITVEQLQPATDNIAICNDIPSIVTSTIEGSVENVSDINGFLIPAFHSRFCFNFIELKRYFDEQYSQNGLLPLVRRYINEVSEFADEFLLESDYFANTQIDKLLRMATIYDGLRNKLFYRIEQIKDYNWMTSEFLNICSQRIASQVSASAQFEVVAAGGSIVGVIDALCSRENMIYELKCTSMIEEEHILQLALYAYLMPGKKYRLYNIFTDELIELHISDASRIAEILLKK